MFLVVSEFLLLKTVVQFCWEYPRICFLIHVSVRHRHRSGFTQLKDKCVLTFIRHHQSVLLNGLHFHQWDMTVHTTLHLYIARLLMLANVMGVKWHFIDCLISHFLNRMGLNTFSMVYLFMLFAYFLLDYFPFISLIMLNT